MHRITWLVLLVPFAIPAVGSAAEGPTVPDEALAAVPPDVRDDWDEAEERIEELTRRIDAERVELEEGSEAPPTTDSARADVRSARAEVTAVRAAARHEREVAQFGVDEAKRARDAAREERKNADEQVSLARAERRNARGEVRDAKRGVREAKDGYRTVKRDTDERIDVAEENVATARRSRSDAADIQAIESSEREIAEAELALLEAQRDVVAAELELEQARAAADTGYPIEVGPFASAVDEARKTERDARDQLKDRDLDDREDDGT